MKKILFLLMMTLGLISCVSEETEPVVMMELVKAPKMIAYSGETILGGTTRGSYMNANMYNQDWDCVENVNLTEEELEELMELLSKGVETVNTVILPFENYWVQQVWKGTDEYTAVDKEGKKTSTKEAGSNKMEHLKAMGNSGYEHINNFNFGNNTNKPGQCGCGIAHVGTTLMTGMPTEGFGATEQFGFDETWGTNPKFYNNYLIVQYKGEWYVGFDYEAHAPERNNPGEAKEFVRDWNFTDWIVKITPAYHLGQTPPKTDNGGEEEKEQEEEEELCESCGGLKHDGACETVEETNPEHEHKNEVEVNLHGSESESHLSIHVRHATDVEVFIPVPKEYYCDADDMAILNKHEGDLIVHGGPESVSYNINGHEVTLNIAFEDGGIRIWTEGINEEVIQYCQETYGDGITFEVWNYYNEMDGLLDYLNRATVRFLDSLPDVYINAFVGENDCNVYPDGEFEEPYTDEHLNGSDQNKIYQKQ